MTTHLRKLLPLILLLLFAGTVQSQTGPAFFEYPSPFGCSGPFSPPVFVINQTTSGGMFSSTPAGLSLDPVSGTVITSTSMPGVYTVTHTLNSPPTDSHSVTIEILEIPEAMLSYPVYFVCKESYSTLQVDTAGVSQFGFYSAFPPGLAIDSTTGEIDVTNSNDGLYTVLHIVTNGVCADTSAVAIEIDDLGGYQLDYGQDTFCPVGNANPLAQPPVPGFFVGIPGLAFLNANLGNIDLTSSSPDRTYIVRYNETGGCQRTFIDTIYLADFDDANFIYSPSVICDNIDSISPTISGDTGVFTYIGQFVNSTLVIDPNTGTINPDLSTPDTYDITHTTNGTCPTTYTQTIHIEEAPPPFTLINTGDTLFEVQVGGFIEWYCDNLLVQTNTNFLPVSQMGVYWATVTNSSGCTTMSNVINTDPTGSPEPNLLSQLVKVFPNPSTGVYHIRTDLETGGKIRAEVFDIHGRKLSFAEYSASAGGDIDLTNHAAGNYLLRITYGNISASYHLLKMAQ